MGGWGCGLKQIWQLFKYRHKAWESKAAPERSQILSSTFNSLTLKKKKKNEARRKLTQREDVTDCLSAESGGEWDNQWRGVVKGGS